MRMRRGAHRALRGGQRQRRVALRLRLRLRLRRLLELTHHQDLLLQCVKRRRRTGGRLGGGTTGSTSSSCNTRRRTRSGSGGGGGGRTTKGVVDSIELTRCIAQRRAGSSGAARRLAKRVGHIVQFAKDVGATWECCLMLVVLVLVLETLIWDGGAAGGSASASTTLHGTRRGALRCAWRVACDAVHPAAIGSRRTKLRSAPLRSPRCSAAQRTVGV